MTSPKVWLVAIVLSVAASPEEARLPPCATPDECVRQAISAARARRKADLRLDSRDNAQLAVILEELRGRHTQEPLPAATVESEARLWGAVFGEIVRSAGYEACWGPSDKAQALRPFVLHLDCDGGWEWDVVGMMAEAITDGPPAGLTVEQWLTLELLD